MQNIYKLASDFDKLTKMHHFYERGGNLSELEADEAELSQKDLDLIDRAVEINELFETLPDEDLSEDMQEKQFNEKVLTLKEKLENEKNVLEEELMNLYNEFLSLDKMFINVEISEIDRMLSKNDSKVLKIKEALLKHDFDSYEEAMGYLMALENEIEKLNSKIENIERKL